MMQNLKAELRKLLSVRSTYFIVGLTLAIIAFLAGFIDGVRGDAIAHANPNLLANDSAVSIVLGGLILAFAGLLLASHEYRYNTITYTLTASNRRYRIVLAKVLVVTGFAVLTGLVVMFFAPLCVIAGSHLAGKPLGAQTYDVASLLWRCAFCNWAYAMYALIALMIIRSQVGAIVTFLLVPLIGENILAQLLKDNSKYLPFNAAQSVVAPMHLGNHTSSGHAALTVLVYVAIGLAIGLILFQKRDAN